MNKRKRNMIKLFLKAKKKIKKINTLILIFKKKRLYR